MNNIDYSSYTSLNELPVGTEFWVKVVVKANDGSDLPLWARVGNGGVWLSEENTPISSVKFDDPARDTLSISNENNDQYSFKKGDIVRLVKLDTTWEDWYTAIIDILSYDNIVEKVGEFNSTIQIGGWWVPADWCILVKSSLQENTSEIKEQIASLEAQLTELKKKVGM